MTVAISSLAVRAASRNPAGMSNIPSNTHPWCAIYYAPPRKTFTKTKRSLHFVRRIAPPNLTSATSRRALPSRHSLALCAFRMLFRFCPTARSASCSRGSRSGSPPSRALYVSMPDSMHLAGLPHLHSVRLATPSRHKVPANRGW